ncbi:3-deoxy-D-arabino-heptulosonate 7-phosphate synthase [Eoetvoesiella caeni]|uniref:3-deoxy-D-arabino-heptulosonate 7-phosphate synthase n=1 Tax=Eoetvoesiella caeni TaxID=645616 RepID=A0A366HBD5_9BURK|nr:3-deoxy-D-arabino-heptulosonate 7-phosphate synthase [Eoetvoesiella caeni]MCI2809149.1 3-deoxy-D-arabino-heptulosonate 7-phosphate synthase [Eoetvoesiella caeni]NYT54293.1 3-deoxy-D-arabino-heptulosonate 7-phosphate synthase [Eoetvoesiella caeni]RBP39525.1 hypothetical protein DFR37_105321 [Eoetvoesiella caeni]
MARQPTPALLDETLRLIARRYRLPAIACTSSREAKDNPATALAIAIEQARVAVARGKVPDEAVKHLFIEALAHMIQQALRAKSGDAAFKAMVLRHREAPVREYASLSAHANKDRRSVHATVNAIAHPAKLQRSPPGRQRDALAQLYASASSGSWSELRDNAHRLLLMPRALDESRLECDLTRLLDSPALGRLQRLDALASNDLVRRYQSLWDRHGPRPGSLTALAQGSASRHRGAAVEALATHALEALARRLNEAEGNPATFRVVTSMRVPASIPASHERAKSEWDAVLLRQAQTADITPAWDVCLLMEAKASTDAATTDLPTLLRGLRLLAAADKGVIYPFKTRQGLVHLRGASLNALTTDDPNLARTVLYCCDAPAEANPRLLSAASRMQLLSAQASLEFASTATQIQHADSRGLEPVWNQLLECPRWRAVLHQYPMLRQVRELMVHADDLLAAADGMANSGHSPG